MPATLSQAPVLPRTIQLCSISKKEHFPRHSFLAEGSGAGGTQGVVPAVLSACGVPELHRAACVRLPRSCKTKRVETVDARGGQAS